ncbi:MAG: DUF4058 family protein, partial [Nostocaceae cyanobacterium]|nr:DUF4058 family protein [Nostocaceae cyanobacterium]
NTVTPSQSGNIAYAAPPIQSVSVMVPMPETVRESYLEVREVTTRDVVCVIEVLSPKNQRSGEGRKAYERKRRRVFGSSTHLVEIDLLRDGKPMLIFGNGIQSDYRILVSREERRPNANLYPFNLKDIISSFPLPLRSEDLEPSLDLQSLLVGIYDRVGYDLVIDYTQEPSPPLSELDVVWNDLLLRQKGLR